MLQICCVVNMRILTLLHIYFMVLDVQVTILLPTPDNVILLSNNFNHTLIWSPGRDTPPGTVYRVSISYDEPKRKKTVTTKKTSINISKYMTDIYRPYIVRLSALFGNRSSSVIQRNIIPYIETVIGPPAVTLSGCGNCFNISISLPEGEGLEKHEEFRKGIKFNLHLKKTGEEKVITVKCPEERSTTLMPYKCFVGNLQPGGNYCVQAQPQLNTNENTQTSDWVCAFTSTVEERGVAFVAGWILGSVLVGLGLLIISASLVYTRSLCRSRMDLPKALTAVVPGRYLSLEEMHLSVAEADTSVKSHKHKQDNQSQADHHIKKTKEHTDRKKEDDDDEEEEEDDYDDDKDNNNYKRENSNCNYMNRGINDSDSQATNSGQSSTSTTTTFCEVTEDSRRCNEKFPPTEAEPAPSNSTVLSQLLHQHLTCNTQVTSADLKPEKPNSSTQRETGQDRGQINRTEAGTSQNISLFSVRLMSLQTTTGDMSCAKDVSQPMVPPLRRVSAGDRLDLLKPQAEKPTLLGLQSNFFFQKNVQSELRSKELPKQKDLPEMRSDQPAKHDKTKDMYMVTHRRILDTETDCLLEEREEEEEDDEEEEEEEEDCSSGYMKR